MIEKNWLDDFEIIDSYTNADAIADGVFQPLPNPERFGILMPVWLCSGITEVLGNEKDTQLLMFKLQKAIHHAMMSKDADQSELSFTFNDQTVYAVLEKDQEGEVFLKLFYSIDR